MTLYADLPGRRSAQLLADLAVLLWCALWAYAGRLVHDATLVLQEPGRMLASAGRGFTGTMTRAGDSVDDLPLLQDRIAEPFRSAAGVGRDFVAAGNDLVSAVDRLALLLGWVTALVPILIVVTVWFLLRLRFVRRATSAQRFIDGAPDLDLFALRAMARQPMGTLARVHPDPAGAWRRQESEVIRALAVLELRSSGLRPPPEAVR